MIMTLTSTVRLPRMERVLFQEDLVMGEPIRSPTFHLRQQQTVHPRRMDELMGQACPVVSFWQICPPRLFCPLGFHYAHPPGSPFGLESIKVVVVVYLLAL